MRLKYVRLVNYGGIMNGMGLSDIEIDFTKCKHSMLVIKGDNGSGKSTLFKTLKPLPDDADMFIPNLPAKKIIEYFGDAGEIYRLEFTHDITNNGGRANAKGSVMKNIGAGFQELNPSGNITSCKDIIYSEFKLDPNYIALSQLSTDDRGLADKKPAERKKFVNAIISSVEVYNNIYKTLAKRSSIFKSMINSITSKIDTIGDIEALDQTLKALETTINFMEQSKDENTKNLARAEGIIASLDPNGSFINKKENLEKAIEGNTAEYNSLLGQLDKLRSSLPKDLLEFGNNYTKMKDKLFDDHTRFTIKKTKAESDIANMAELRNKLNGDIEAKKAKLETLRSKENEADLEKGIAYHQAIINECEKLFREIGLEEGTILTKDEYVLGIRVLEEIQNAVENFQDAYYDNIVHDILNETIVIEPNYKEVLQKQLNVKKEFVDNLDNEIAEYHKLETIANLLSDRPTECKIDSCNFIKEALAAKTVIDKISITELQRQRDIALNDFSKIYNEIQRDMEILEGRAVLNKIYRLIDSSASIIKKLPIRNILLEKSALVNRIVSRVPLTEIDLLKKYLERANIFEDYAYAVDMKKKLETEYKLYLSKKEAIDTLMCEIGAITMSLKDLKEKAHQSNDDLIQYNEYLNDNFMLQGRVEAMDELSSRIDSCARTGADLENEYNKLIADMGSIEKNLGLIQTYQSNISAINADLINKYRDRDTLKHKVGMLKDYEKELTEYRASYDKIETIKYYSSPTTGIQTLFMELYMNKIIQLANKLLALLFDGLFHLDQFVINENEFRIPCSGGNLPHDDISSMSSSQIACISMILSFALLYQSSSKLNILKLDEIDGALDSTNRRNFIIMLEQMLEVLYCQQCIIISHNDELNLDNCDVIVLKHNNIEPIMGNIIWKY